MSEQKTAQQLAEEFKAANEKAIDGVKAIAEEALGKIKAGEKVTDQLKQDADEALVKMNELGGQVAELAQKMARTASGEDAAPKSLGQQYVESDGFKSWADGRPRQGKADLAVKTTITTSVTDAPGSVGAAPDRTRLPGIRELPQQRPCVRDQTSQGRID